MGKPNIILILADDMGYGDPQCYNPQSKVPTPHINRLAREGMKFTDAHTTSSVCTPTRYGIITGQYSWRSSLKRGVSWSYSPLLIDTAKSTIASVLKKAGYKTACVGKWHLGLGWQMDGDSVLFNKPLTAGPLNLGFDEFYGLSASLDIPPYVYIRGNKVVQQPTAFTEGPSPLITDDFWRLGPVSPDFKHEDVLNHLTDVAENNIREGAKADKPFFLYFALTAPHLPWSPTDEFRGKSGAGNYGDLMAEVDAVVGRINNLVRSLGIEKETLIIFTSDNGSQFTDEEMKQYNHQANHHWRGRKGDIYEGGNRVPFLVKWPAKIKAGSTSGQLVSTTDFLATFTQLAGASTPGNEKKDSYSFLPVLTAAPLGKTPLRKQMVYHSSEGMFALRSGSMVFVKGMGSGGFLKGKPESGDTAQFQLYNLQTDREQKKNFYTETSLEAKKMLRELEVIVNNQ